MRNWALGAIGVLMASAWIAGLAMFALIGRDPHYWVLSAACSALAWVAALWGRSLLVRRYL